MSKKNNDATKAKKPRNSISKLSQACIIASMITWLTGAIGIATVYYFSQPEISQQNLKLRQDNLGQLVSSLVQHKVANIQSRLQALASNDNLYNALAFNDDIELKNIAANYSPQFEHVESLQIIPWDQLGTAGIKQRGIELRNNIEIMLLTKAAKLEKLEAETYRHDKKWLVSFATPVSNNDQVIGIILLTYKASLLKSLLNIPAITNQGSISLYRKGSEHSMLTLGNGDGEVIKLPLPFDGGELRLQIKTQQDLLDNTFNEAYLTLAICLFFMGLIPFVLYKFMLRYLTVDSELIVQYTQSLKGLHEPKKPQLLNSQLQQIIDAISKLRDTKNFSINEAEVGTANTNKVTAEKNSSVAISAAWPPKAEEVVETFRFDSPGIFKDYDIRGNADSQLHSDNVRLIGQAIGSEAQALGQYAIVLGFDSRPSSPRIAEALAEGLLASGCDVIKLGEVTTPISYYAAHKLNTLASAMITGSHNGEEENGIKITLNGKSLHGEGIQKLLARVELHDFKEGQGELSENPVTDSYLEEIADDIIIATPTRVLLDGNSELAAALAKNLLQQSDCEVVEFKPSGTQKEILAQLSDKVREENFDLAIAFDSDADRLMAISNSGEIIAGDKLLMLFAKDIVTRNPGASVVFDVKCSKELSSVITQSGGRAVMYKTGHSNIKAKMLECDAIFAGELTGHYYFKERWYGFDDGIYAALRLVELLSASEQSFDERLSELPQTVTSDEYIIPVAKEEDKANIVAFISDTMKDQKGEKITIDGFRIEFDAGWGLVRPSNTAQAITLRFEAKTEDLLSKLQALFKAALLKADPNLNIPF